MKIILSILFAITLVAVSVTAAEPMSHRLLMISSLLPGEINILDGDGKSVWSFSSGYCSDATVMEDGNLFIGVMSGAIMVRMSDKKILWRYTVPAGCQNTVAQPLAGGRFLVGNEGPCKLLEIDANGAVLKEIQGQSKSTGNHWQFGLCRKTGAGSYLFPEFTSHTLREYNVDGKLIFEITNVTCVAAVRLPNGNTLVGNGCRLDEYDRMGKLVWRFDCIDDANLKPIKGAAYVAGITRLKNGNTIFAYEHTDPNLPDIIEVSPEKKILYSLILPAMNKVLTVQILDPAMKPSNEMLAR